MAYTYRYIRVTSAGKVEDRFLTVQLSKSDDPAKANYGTLFNLIEITSKWFPTAQISQSIVNTLRREYFKGASTSELENFENAIKKVNEQLAASTQNGENEWIGNLHSQLVLVNGNDAHLCATGGARSYLFRDGKAIQISEPRKHDADTPVLKTFSSITSGNLQDKDVLFLSSSNTFDFISTQDIKESLDEGSVYAAANTLVRKLQQHKVRNTAFAMVEILTDNSASAKPMGDPEVIYLDQALESGSVKARRVLAKYFLPALAKTANQANKLYQKAKHSFSTYVLPQSLKMAKTIQEKTKPLAKQALEKTKQSIGQIKIKTPSIGKKESASASTDEAQAGSLIGKNIFNIHDYTAAKPKRRLNIPLYSPVIYQRAKLFVRNPRNRPLLYILGTIFLVLVLVVSVSIQKKNQNNANQHAASQTTLDSAKQRLEEGKTALVFNNKNEAQIAFTDAIKQAKNLLNSKFASDAKAIINEAEGQLDKLVGSNRLKNLKPAISFADASNIVSNSGKIIATDKQANKVYIGDLIDGQTQTTTNNVEGTIQAIHASKDTVYVLTDSALYTVDTSNNSLTKQTLSNDAKIVKSIDLADFIGNLYTLAPADNQIWKYPFTNNQFQKQSAYIKGGTKIAGAVSFAIDGSVYVLDSAGKVTKFSQGKKQDFTLTGLPAGLDKIDNPLTIFTAEESSSIFVADGGALPRILEFDKQGKFLQQFLFQSDLDTFKDVWFQPTGRKAWGLFGNSVYELNL